MGALSRPWPTVLEPFRPALWLSVGGGFLCLIDGYIKEGGDIARGLTGIGLEPSVGPLLAHSRTPIQSGAPITDAPSVFTL